MGAFSFVIAVGTVVLMFPISHQSNEPVPFITALFTATSAVCVTGLTTVDTATYWSGFGKTVIMALIQVGGLGVMSLATLIGLTITKSMNFTFLDAAAIEGRSNSFKGFRYVLARVLKITLAVEAVVSLVLILAFKFRYNFEWLTAIELGVFHSISAFNNAGFSLFTSSLIGFADDPFVLVPISIAIIIGGLGFPVLLELGRHLRHTEAWSLLVRVTLVMTAFLVAVPTFAFWISEWDNPQTMSRFGTFSQFISSLFMSVTARTAGFNIFDYADVEKESLILTNVLMFIGGGTAGTSGGVKVTTIAVVFFIVMAEIRGRDDVVIGNRRIPDSLQRQAVSLMFISSAVVVAVTSLMMAITNFTFEQVLFEVISAFGTVGLSMGITPELSATGQVVMTFMMLLGRTGPMVLATALSFSYGKLKFRYPEEKIAIG